MRTLHIPHSNPPYAGSAVIAAALACGIAACGGPAAGNDVTRERMPSGVERTTWHTLRATPLGLDTVAVWHLWQNLEGHQFGDVRSATGADGGFYLLDGVNRQVVHVDRVGAPIRVFGRQGAGPGEFEAPLRLVARDGEIWVADIALGRYTVFGADGSFRRVVPWGGPGGRIGADGFTITAGGGELFSTWSIRGSWLLQHASLDGSWKDTLAVMRTLPRAEAVITIPGIGPTTMFDPPAYTPELHWTSAGEDRVITVTSAEYRIEERDLTGRILRELVGPSPDLTVTGSDREAFLARFARIYNVDEDAFRDANPGLENRYPFAERRSAIESIRVDPFGRLWVQANTAGSDSTRIDLFDGTFVFQGSLDGFPRPEAFTAEGDALFRFVGGDDDGTDLFLVVRVVAR